MRAHIVSKTLANVKRKFKIVLKRKKLDDYSNLSITAAVFWFLVRVLPRPSRITYPCQRATLSLLLVKTGIVLASATSIVTDLFKRKSVKIVFFCLLVGIIVAEPAEQMYYQLRYSILAAGNKNLTLADISVSFPTNRVVRVHGDSATSWDFSTGYYWEYVDQSVSDRMVEEGVKALTGASDAQGAWQIIMDTYVLGDIVGIKVNGNDWWYGNVHQINSLPELTNSIIRGLKTIGVPESDIRIIENTHDSITLRVIPQYYTDIIKASFPNVVFQYDSAIRPSYGSVSGTDVSFPYTSVHRINDQIASVDHLILIPIMKAITPIWGVTGSIKLMQGVIERVGDFHDWLHYTTPDNPNVLMYQNQHIIGKTRLIVGDGLFGAWTGIHFNGPWGGIDTVVSPNHRDDVPNRWITFDNGAPNCLFFGVDPVAIDSVMYDHILAERNAQNEVPGQSMAPFNEPQLIAGEAAGLGIREHGPPYSNIDYAEIELGEAPSPVHDVAVTNVSCWPTTVATGELVYINVTVVNEGDTAETFSVTAYYNQSEIETQTDIYLIAGSTEDLGFIWNTTGVAEGTYTLRAEAGVVSGETDTTDNSFINGMVIINPPVHDVAIVSVSPDTASIVQGHTVTIHVTAENQGTLYETFAIEVYANQTPVESKGLGLAAGDSKTTTFHWDTTGFVLGSYTISANASVVPDEVDITDNSYVDGIVEIVGATETVHDIAILGVTVSPTIVNQGQFVTIQVDATNEGNVGEVFTVTVYANATPIESKDVSLTAGSSISLPFLWNTTTTPLGKYMIAADAGQVPGEEDLADNSYVDGTVTVNLGVHDVAIISVSVSQVTGYPGQLINVTVVAGNEGTFTEDFTITAYANSTVIGSQTVTLTANSTRTEILTWNTTEALGVYLIKAEASVVEGEDDTADNIYLFDGSVAIFTHPVTFPTASFIYLPIAPSVGETVTFNASNSIDPDGSIVSYSWDFGDGTEVTETSAVTTHVFSAKGNYTVTLTVTDNDGLFDTATHQVSIKEKTQPMFPMELVLSVVIIVVVVFIALMVFRFKRLTR